MHICGKTDDFAQAPTDTIALNGITGFPGDREPKSRRPFSMRQSLTTRLGLNAETTR